MASLSEHIRSERLTQKAFAGRVGVDQATISKLCRGLMVPSLCLAFRIQKMTGGAVPVDSWLGDVDPNNSEGGK